MGKQGSITVFMALILSLIIALVCTSVESVKMAASRVQIANGADIGLYSLFAQYDRKLLDDYELFYIDGSWGSSALELSRVYDTVEQYMEPVLEQNWLQLKLASGGITGYTLASAQGGRPFRAQAAAYVKDTLGSQGVQLLLEKVKTGAAQAQGKEELYEQAQREHSMEKYDGEMEAAAENSSQAEQDLIREQGEEAPIVQPAEGSSVENPIDTIRQVQKMGILELVLPNPEKVSQKTIDTSSLASHRQLDEGMPVIGSIREEDGVGEKILFQEYLLQKCGSFSEPCTSGGLSYGAEYVLGGKDSDTANLKKVVQRLLLIREGANLVHLLADSTKRAQASALALAIASGFLVPPAASIIEMVLLLCWSFGESILDVRQLMGGHKVPTVKNMQNWQLSLENLPHLLELLDTAGKEEQSGLGYQDYLRALLFLEQGERTTLRGMDLIEAAMRCSSGYEGFCFDTCLEALEVEIDVAAGSLKTFTVLRQYGYNL